MPRDPTAQTIQGADNGTGNPLLVTTAAGTQSEVDIREVLGVAAVTAAAGVLRVGIADSTNEPIAANTTGDAANAVQIDQEANLSTRSNPEANTAAVVTLTAVAGQRHRISTITLNFFGANVAVTFNITDGGTDRFNITIPAAQNAVVHLEFPNGGLRGSVNSEIVVTLPAGGAGVSGNLNVTSKVF